MLCSCTALVISRRLALEVAVSLMVLAPCAPLRPPARRSLPLCASLTVLPPDPPLDPLVLNALLAHDPLGAALALAALDATQRYAQARAQVRLPTRHGTAVAPAALLDKWAWLLRATCECGGEQCARPLRLNSPRNPLP